MAQQSKILEELTADGTPSGVEFEASDVSQRPFDPEKIYIKTKEIPMDTIIRRIRKGTINLAPSFQRKSVWSQERKSQLIESLMLKIPLPMFYVAGNTKEEWDVVDGLQRLTTICEFLFGSSEYSFVSSLNESDYTRGFRLKGLEFWGNEYNGKKFNELPDILQTRIIESAFTFTIIEPGTPEAVRRNIFKRINTGGMPLTAQEIRHALYQGKSTELLAELAESKCFKTATNYSIDDSRMAARELILRMLSFILRSYKNYPNTGDMDAFICDTMMIINNNPNKLDETEDEEIRVSNIDELITLFEKSMRRAESIFGTYAFRKSIEGTRRTPINKSLFEVWGTILARMPENKFLNITKNIDDFKKEYETYIINNDLDPALSRNSWMKKSVTLRFSMTYDLVRNYGVEV